MCIIEHDGGLYPDKFTVCQNVKSVFQNLDLRFLAHLARHHQNDVKLSYISMFLDDSWTVLVKNENSE